MNWKAYHSRGEILHDVIDTADARRDGLLPMDVEGVTEKFENELDLLCALQLKWHTNLAGRIDRFLAEQPMNLEDAVINAWHSVADEYQGVRLILDHYRSEPIDTAMATAMRKAAAKEHLMLAVMCGYSSVDDELAIPIGARIDERARVTFIPSLPTAPERATIISRIRSALAA